VLKCCKLYGNYTTNAQKLYVIGG